LAAEEADHLKRRKEETLAKLRENARKREEER
jgi:hypothetical protein